MFGIINEDNLISELCKRNLRPRVPIMNSDREKLITNNHFDRLDDAIEEILTEVDAISDKIMQTGKPAADEKEDPEPYENQISRCFRCVLEQLFLSPL